MSEIIKLKQCNNCFCKEGKVASYRRIVSGYNTTPHILEYGGLSIEISIDKIVMDVTESSKLFVS